MHGAIADNKYLLRQSRVAVTVDGMENRVYTDERWVRFVLNQIISNAVKYRSGEPAVHFLPKKGESGIFVHKG